MQLNIDLGFKEEQNNSERVKEAQAKKVSAQYEPTWEEVWVTGWTNHRGTFKKGIFSTKLTELDKKRLLEVKNAIEDDLIGTGVESLKNFTKSHALKMYQDVKDVKRDSVVADMKKYKPHNYHIVTGRVAFNRMIDLLEQEELLALDTETTGVQWEDTTVGMSFSLPKADKHFYIPYAHNTDVEQIPREHVLARLKPVLERKGLKLVLHNSKFDAHMLEKDGIDIRDNVYWDTMIAMHVLNENEASYALKKLANKYGKFFGYTDDSYTFEELFGKDPQEFINADLEVAGIYACKDTHLTLLFYQWQLSMMQKQPKLLDVYLGIEQKNTHVALEMESNGFEIDLDFAEKYGKELKERIEVLSTEIENNWGDVNINSPSQLATLFYDTLGYKDVSGSRSVGAKWLKKMAKEHPEVNTLLEYRDLNKLLSTYVDPLPSMVRKDVPEKGLKGDYRLHGSFMQTGTVTGRYASNSPNLQNIEPRARKMFVAPKGKLMIGIDYSQIEPRTLASMSGDKDFSKPYIEGGDLYVQIASDVYGIPYEHCLEADDTYWREHTTLPKHPRKLAKVILLAVMYGISPMSLSESIQASVEEAEQFIEDFYSAYPVVKEWMNGVVEFADTNGYVETMHGRKRRFLGHRDVAKQYKHVSTKIKGILGSVPKNIWQAELPRNLKRQYWNVNRDYSRVERMSVNAVIQGSASEILKKAMIAVYEHLKDKDGWRLLATIHDELLFEIPETATPEEIRELADIMLNTTTLDSIPVKCDVEVMTRWGEGIPMAEWIEKGSGRVPFEK